MKEKIDDYIDNHKMEMIEDIKKLVRINSERTKPKENMPYGEGPKNALDEAYNMMKCYGFDVKNYDNYVVTADLNHKEKNLDILAHLDVVPAGEGWTVTNPFEPCNWK